jgi:hypothetical protein
MKQYSMYVHESNITVGCVTTKIHIIVRNVTMNGTWSGGGGKNFSKIHTDTIIYRKI